MTNLPHGMSAGRLTGLLREAGALRHGDVADGALETTRDTLISRITRLRLTYVGGDVGPSHVFVKTQRDGMDPPWHEFGQKEVNFYRLAAPETPIDLLPRCYEAVVETGGDWRLALEDFTTTHEALGEWPLPPRVERLDAVVAAHARFHAQWWGHSRLGTIAGFSDVSGTFDRYLARMPAELATFCDRLGDRLSADRRHV